MLYYFQFIMLKTFVSVLLIVKGITASDTCDIRCNNSSLAIRQFPETNEVLQKICIPYIEYIECEIHKEEICHQLNPRILQMGYRLISTIQEVCSEYTLLHAAIVDNLKCWNGKLRGEDNAECNMREIVSNRVKQIAEALSIKGLTSLAENPHVNPHLDSCPGLMNLYACQSFVIERTCGAVAMGAYVEILRKVRPFGFYYLRCEELYELLPLYILLRKS